MKHAFKREPELRTAWLAGLTAVHEHFDGDRQRVGDGAPRSRCELGAAH